MNRKQIVPRFNNKVTQALSLHIEQRRATKGNIIILERYLLHYITDNPDEQAAKRLIRLNQQARVKVQYEQTGKIEFWYCFARSRNPRWQRN